MTNMSNISSMLEQSRAIDYYLLIRSPPIVAYFYLWGYLIIFILGFTGNIASLLTFIRPTLRRVSTGTLFIVLAISDTLFLFASIFDFIDFGLQVPLYGRINYDILCSYRVFVISMTQICSAWILVIISIDRWIRTRFPHKSARLCTPKKALIAVVIVIFVDAIIHSPMLTPFFGMLLPGVAIIACGPNVKQKLYLNFYYYTWTIIQIFINCLIPGLLMLLVLLDMFINIRVRKRALSQQIQFQNQTINRNRFFQKELFLLMLSSIIIFLTTTLPIATFRIIFPKQVLTMKVEEYGSVMSISAGLTCFWSFNYAINFYIHCLTSKLFRKEFIELIKFISKGNHNAVLPITHTRITQFTPKRQK
ncbi:unnamed protein product [Rotaria sordida]|uniref:G-protein coupled receptors family 1 profile domain-containing protein n=1 Tax=Rotaria sordida TaxID=392033 RepID=A0A818QFR4_9BILA|nr:unnamed protein product [Rotaria sordida]CAF0904371.1 unnamed protein product [Rotaria sordida]CAF0914922.1 unnamed protein product [Rotaria sordida]CAF0924377.1 unnamed protein product [Rotaria sordida]CAF3568163.1 unnamed protein product [Rotaria sordida]